MAVTKLGSLAVLATLLSLVSTATGQDTRVITLSGNSWLLATDPQNVGREQSWFKAPRPEARKTAVPWTIQSVFPGYSGVAWYWRDVAVPARTNKGSRYLLRFWDVDYLADVWVNGKYVGMHEGAQTRFTLDATAAVAPGTTNHIAVRVLSPFGAPIDGIVRSQTPHGAFRDFNIGGILDDVELIIAPEVRSDDLFVRADPITGKVRVEATVINSGQKTVRATVRFVVAPATSGEPIATVSLDREIKPGRSLVFGELKVDHPRLWDLDNPNLYRLTSRISSVGSSTVDESSTRFGFREFRFENGYFRLNGRRIFWTSAHTGADTPITIRIPYDRSLLRRDLVNLKASGFKGIRFISIMGQRYQLDMCDEIGLLVNEESHASWMLDDSPKMAERMDSSLTGMVLRDRNHPSVGMWGLLNETGPGAVFNHALASLPLMRRLDDSRVILLSSGRFDATNIMNGLEIWKPETGFAPCLTHNPKSHSISGVTLFRPGEVSLIPGVGGEFGVARWTAPEDGEYVVEAAFRGTGMYSVNDIHVLQAGKEVYRSSINENGRGDRHAWSCTVHLTKGQTLDFVVGGATPGGGAWYEKWTNDISLTATIKGGSANYQLAADFSNTKNPNGTWRYGWLAPGLTPDASTFRPFVRCETVRNESPGGICNPGSDHWEDILGDQHYYPRVPHRELEIARLRGIAINDKPIFLSEYGIGSGIDLPRFILHHQQLGVESGERLDLVKNELAAFMVDWNRLKLDEAFAGPEDFFRQCVSREAGLKAMGINAIRSNPNMVGYGMTGLNDPLEFGEGFTTAFRELKPGTTDAIFEAFYPVKWCTFADPVHAYRGAKIHFEAVLSNEDSAPPGNYPARIQVVDPNYRKVIDRTITVTIPGRANGKDPSFAIPVFDEEIPIDGPSGKYRFIITFQRGVVATGGEAVFDMSDPADMPHVDTEVRLWGEDPELAAWLGAHGIRVRPYQPGPPQRREVILVSDSPDTGGTAEAWRDLASRIAQGSTAVFLCPEVFKKAGNPLGWLPLANKGGLEMVSEYWFPQVYPKDEWSKAHALFEGLPSGRLMDHTFYRELIPDFRFVGQETPTEALAGSFRTSHPGAYQCDTMLSVYDFGAGRFILNALRVRQELSRDPTAERLLRNMLRYAARDEAKPLSTLPAVFGARLKAIGY